MEIYLDNSATTRACREAAAAMGEALEICYGNPSSLHRKGLEAEKIVRRARRTMAETIHGDPSEIVFTSGGTESNNLGIQGYLNRNPHAGKRIVTSAVEHPSVLNLFRHLAKRYEVVELPVDGDGRVSPEALEAAVDSETALVSIMAVNNEIGTIQPLSALSRAIRSKNPRTVFHVDAVQALGKIPLDVKAMGIDMLSASGHKFHGPKGVGLLHVGKGLRLEPLFYGGNQESGLRSGTENVPAIAGMEAAARGFLSGGPDQVRRMARYKERLVSALESEMEDMRMLSAKPGFAPNIVTACFKDIRAEVLLHALEQDGIYVSSGSACSSKKKGSSHVLEAIRLPEAYIGGAVRMSFTWENDSSEIEPFVARLKTHVAEIRQIMKR